MVAALLSKLPSGRELDPERLFIHGFRRLDNRLLKRGEWPHLDRLVSMIPEKYRDVLGWLRIDDDTMAVPVGYDWITMFAMLFSFDSGPVVFETANVEIYTNPAT